MKIKVCSSYPAPNQAYVQQLTTMAKRAHAWAFVAPLSAVAKIVSAHQRVTHHHAVRF